MNEKHFTWREHAERELINEILTKKYLFYYCYVNFCYCVVRVAFNFSICMMNRYGIFGIIHCVVTDGLCPSVYSRGEGNCSPSLDTAHCAVHRWKYRQTQIICLFQRQRELSPLALFTVQHTDGNTNSLCPSMYSRVEENCSPPPSTVHSQ